MNIFMWRSALNSLIQETKLGCTFQSLKKQHEAGTAGVRNAWNGAVLHGRLRTHTHAVFI